MRKILFMSAAVIGLSALGQARAAVIDLTVEGINSPTDTSNPASIEDFYNGGTSSVGTSGPDYGISFPSNEAGVALPVVLPRDAEAMP